MSTPPGGDAAAEPAAAAVATAGKDVAAADAKGGGDAPPKPPRSRFVRFLLAVWDLICEHWFILGLGFAIGFGAAVPDFGRNGGWIAAQYTIKYGAVIVIFLLSGMSLKTRVLLTAASRVHFHLLVQAMSLVVTPAIGFGIASALGTAAGINDDLIKGLVVAMAMPTTISTNVVFTKQAGGNDASALVNAVIGNLIGIFISPGWLYLYLGRSSQAPYQDVIQQLAVTIIAPLIVGQLLQYWKPDLVKKFQEKVNFGKVGNVMILLLVWNTFCNTFYKDIHLGAGSWVPMLFVEIGLYVFFTLLCVATGTFYPLKRLFSIGKPDAVALIFCGSTKTLALGMPLITALYGKQDNVGIISLPLIIYHATQCLLGSLMIPRIKAWSTGPSPGAWPKGAWAKHVAALEARKAASGAPEEPLAGSGGGANDSSGRNGGGGGGPEAAAGVPPLAGDADVERGLPSGGGGGVGGAGFSKAAPQQQQGHQNGASNGGVAAVPAPAGPGYALVAADDDSSDSPGAAAGAGSASALGGERPR